MTETDTQAPAELDPIGPLFTSATSYPAAGGTFERPVPAEHIAAVVLPNQGDNGESWSVEVMDFEQYQPHPRRARGAVRVRTVASLIDYVKRHQDGGTIAFVDDAGAIRVVLNHHAGAGASAGWGDHTVTLERERTTAFAAWLARDGRDMAQEEFAAFLDRRMGEIITPPGAELMEVAAFFQATKSVAFTSGRAQHNGAITLNYTESISESGGRDGNITVPQAFTLLLRPYKDSPAPEAGQPDPYQFTIPAKLRYHLEGQKVKFRFELSEELEDLLAAIHQADVERFELTTSVTVLHGALA